MKVNVIDVLESLSKAQSVISPKIGAHQQQVAYLSYRIADKLDKTRNRRVDLLVAGLCHDIGALSFKEKDGAISEHIANVNTHAFRGAYLMKEFLPDKNLSGIIKYHHYHWEYGAAAEGNPDMPYESQILHLADRVCAYIAGSKFVLSQVPKIKEYVEKNKGELFVEEQADAFLELAGQESMWLDLVSEDQVDRIDRRYCSHVDMTIDELVNLSWIFSHLIDFRSPFTSTHSASVANVAKELAKLMNFSTTECKKMLIAGYLHDLGKLTVNNDILEKQAALDAEEYDIIRSHTYYTYYLLDEIEAFQDIKGWAAFHHERLNGKGYPFHLDERELTLGARIMAVADVFSALQEKRPYKSAMEKEEIFAILWDMVNNGSLDTNVVLTLEKNFQHLSEVCSKAKDIAQKDYSELYSI